ncbi:MAG TPA: hypothetical protein VFS43_43490 [Polyangiaceae bacterium]|nr:hypothetical protein [Polyangiaceae bacterium]
MSAPMTPPLFAQTATSPAQPPTVAPPARTPQGAASARTPGPLERWAPEAQKLASSEMHLAVPFHVLLGEAVDVARFHETYFASVGASDGQPARPGLDTVIDERRGMTASTGEDILSLREATQQAHARYLIVSSPAGAAPVKRGRFVVGEIAAALGYLFGGEGARAAQLAALRAAHAGGPRSADALAAALEEYAALGEAHRGEIAGLGGFDPGLLDEAREVARALRERPAAAAAPGDEVARALALRNRLATLLAAKMNAVRAAARFVFRHRPEIVREATSAYERHRRAASRRGARAG